ncbi:DUF1934 domain-containing protein [Enterococcus nangangensis]
MDLKNSHNITVHLTTQVQQGAEQAEFTFDLAGQLVQMGDTLYIRYKEVPEEGGEEIPVTIKIEPEGNVQIMRGTTLKTRLKFFYRQTINNSYRTPYGLLEVQTYTKDLHFSLKDQPLAGSLKLDYDLLTPQQTMGSYQLQLNFQATGAKG